MSFIPEPSTSRIRRAFTVLELVGVLLIIGVLSGLGAVTYTQFIAKTGEKVGQAEVTSVVRKAWAATSEDAANVVPALLANTESDMAAFTTTNPWMTDFEAEFTAEGYTLELDTDAGDNVLAVASNAEGSWPVEAIAGATGGMKTGEQGATSGDTSGGSTTTTTTTTTIAAGAPDAPVGVTPTATSTAGQIYIVWSLGDDGGASQTFSVTVDAVDVGCSTAPCVVSSLTPGTPVDVIVSATNSVGTTPAAPVSVTPLDIPSTPTISDVTRSGSGEIVIDFAAPTIPVDSYTIAWTDVTDSSTGSQLVEDGDATFLVVDTLSDGHRYDITLEATNVVGSTTSAAFTKSVLDPTTPHLDAVEITSAASPNNTGIMNVTWDAPAATTPASPIMRYELRVLKSDGTGSCPTGTTPLTTSDYCSVDSVVTAGTATSASVANLPMPSGWTVVVLAVNAVNIETLEAGTDEWALSWGYHDDVVTVLDGSETVPAGVTGVTATDTATGQLSVSWTEGADGGAPILGAQVAYYDKTDYTQTPTCDTGFTQSQNWNYCYKTFDAGTDSAVINGLVDGERYNVTVYTYNIMGWSDGVEVIGKAYDTTAAPVAPVMGAWTPGTTSGTATWTASDTNGGASISRYALYYKNTYEVLEKNCDGGGTVSSHHPTLCYFNLDGDTTSLTFTGLKPGHMYSYYVVAENTEGLYDITNWQYGTQTTDSSAENDLVGSFSYTGTAHWSGRAKTISFVKPVDTGNGAITHYAVAEFSCFAKFATAPELCTGTATYTGLDGNTHTLPAGTVIGTQYCLRWYSATDSALSSDGINYTIPHYILTNGMDWGSGYGANADYANFTVWPYRNQTGPTGSNFGAYSFSYSGTWSN